LSIAGDSRQNKNSFPPITGAKLRIRGGYVSKKRHRWLLALSCGFVVALLFQSKYSLITLLVYSNEPHHTIYPRGEFVYSSLPFPLSIWAEVGKSLRNTLHNGPAAVPGTDIINLLATFEAPPFISKSNPMDSYYFVYYVLKL
jgi:hypothetical protein